MANEVFNRDDLKEEFNKFRKEIKDSLAAIKSSGQEGLDQAGDRLNQAYKATRKSGAQATGYARDEIESHPIASISLALIAGMVLGKLISMK